MSDKSRLFICFFDGHEFKKLTSLDRATGEILICHFIDGLHAEEGEWTYQQQRAVARDMANAFPQHLHSQLSEAQRETAGMIWDALMLAPSRCAHKAACRQLVEAPPLIQQALTHEIAATIKDNQEMHDKRNPFTR